MGFSKTKIAEMLVISRKTLYNKTSRLSNVQGDSVTMTPKYTDITDIQLDSMITSIKRSHSNDAEVMVTGYLLRDGIRISHSRIRASIHRFDPDRVAERKSKAVKRRVYQVSSPNDLWHVDGNHKLINWCFVVHSGIDGY